MLFCTNIATTPPMANFKSLPQLFLYLLSNSYSNITNNFIITSPSKLLYKRAIDSANVGPRYRPTSLTPCSARHGNKINRLFHVNVLHLYCFWHFILTMAELHTFRWIWEYLSAYLQPSCIGVTYWNAQLIFAISMPKLPQKVQNCQIWEFVEW